MLAPSVATSSPPSARVTPMLRQYFEMKSRHPDAILFYRMGDFYEMFFDDAKDAAPLLGIALTARHRDSDIEAPMCGVPHQAIEHHVAKLVAAGRKVAICDQTEDPASRDENAAKGLVDRAVVRAERIVGRIRAGDVKHDPQGGSCPEWCVRRVGGICRVGR